MRKSFILLTILTILCSASLAFGWTFQSDWDFGATAYSTSSTSVWTPNSYSSGDAEAYAAGDWAFTYTQSESTATSSSSSSFAVAGIICDEPPVCDDTDGDGVCDESDNCEFVPNSDQADVDDDQIGDVCDECPCDPTNTCGQASDGCLPPPVCEPDDTACLLEEACPCENDWRNHGAYVTCITKFRNDHKNDEPPLPNLETIVSDAGCSDCGGSHNGQGCDDDGDGVTNSRDDCPDTPKGVEVDEFGCAL